MDRWVLLKVNLSPGCCGSMWPLPVPHSSFISVFGFQRRPQSKTQKDLCGSMFTSAIRLVGSAELSLVGMEMIL